MAKIKKERILEAMRMSGGMIAAVAHMLGVTRKTVYNWMKSDPELKAEMEDIREDSIDMVESQLFRNVQKGNQRAIEYYLNNMAKDRGYGIQNTREIIKPQNQENRYDKMSDAEIKAEAERYAKILGFVPAHES